MNKLLIQIQKKKAVFQIKISLVNIFLKKAKNFTKSKTSTEIFRIESTLAKDKFSLKNKSNNLQGKNLQKEIQEIKEDITNNEYILKAKNQRMKELKQKLNDLNSEFLEIEIQLNDKKEDLSHYKNAEMLKISINRTKIENENSFEKDDSKINFDKDFLNFGTNINAKEVNISNLSDISNINSIFFDDKKTKKFQPEINLNEVIEECENAEKEKKETEENLLKMKNVLKEKDLELERSREEFKDLQQIYEKSEKEYGELRKENILKEKRSKFISQFFENHEIFIKKFESEMQIIKNRVELNKSIFEKLEKDMVLKLYFVRFSNSMVRSLFNIVNIRRLHIEMLKIFSKRDMESYGNLFKKLDETEGKIIKEYNEFHEFVRREGKKIE